MPSTSIVDPGVLESEVVRVVTAAVERRAKGAAADGPSDGSGLMAAQRAWAVVERYDRGQRRLTELTAPAFDEPNRRGDGGLAPVAQAAVDALAAVKSPLAEPPPVPSDNTCERITATLVAAANAPSLAA